MYHAPYHVSIQCPIPRRTLDGEDRSGRIEGEGKGDHIGRADDRALEAGERDALANRLAGRAGRRNGLRLSVSIAGFLSGVQFCDYFDDGSKTGAYGLSGHWWRGGQRSKGDSMMLVNGGGSDCAGFRSMAIYRALGVENIRHRRKARNSVLMRRLLSLDFVLKHPGLNWLPTEPEKRSSFLKGSAFHSNLIPRRIYYGAVRAQKRYFALKLPVAGGAETVTFRLCRSRPGEHRRTQHMGSRACSALGCDPRQGATGGGNRHWCGTGYGFAGGSGATALGGGGAGEGGSRG